VLGKSLAITIDGATIQTLKVDKLLPFLNPKGGYNQDTLRNFAKGIAAENNKEVAEPIFKFDGKRVQEFTPGTNGVAVEEDLFYQNLSIALASLERTGDSEISLEVPHNKTLPQTAVSDVNNLGIKELIGEGTSRFSGSIASRIYNVALASSRINGVLVAPNETFSFASAIGDISKYTGYKEAYIIQNGKTILGDGGGVCQVSTTLFRAVMNAGLPIIERHAHAYRVGYYEQGSGPGLDATVFVPSVDFKFLNDTGHYVLVQTKVDTKNLTADFKIYGTSDGRKSTVTKPVITNQIAPPDDLYVDDPTIPAGKVVQIEHRAWGARVSFSYTVTRDGAQIYQKNFTSVYQPWQAVYQRGVGPT
jgi:vancomycin resistance protein YoaR